VKWRNWGRTAGAEVPVFRPNSAAELAGWMRSHPGPVKALGSGHSFSAIGQPVGAAIDLRSLRGLVAVDEQRGRVTLKAGTVLRAIPDLLGPFGLAMQNLGDIDAQTLAGAIATGTHGTGASFPGIAGQVAGLTLVDGRGAVVRIDEDSHSDWLPLAAVGLGALGIVTDVTLQCVPAFVLAARERPMPLSELESRWDELFTASDHFEFHWFPGTEIASTKTNTRLPGGVPLLPRSRARRIVDGELLANGVFSLSCQLGAVLPAVVQPVNKMSAALMANGEFTEPSHRVFTANRRVRFREMEYAVPLEQLSPVFAEIRALTTDLGDPIEFPIEVRTAAADDIAMSTGYGRPTGYIAVHRYRHNPFVDYFRRAEQILCAHGGRPHWGKMHTMDAGYLSEVYPRFEEFRALRARLDPDGRFVNPYLRRVLGDL
jgi:FAD-linked oxidoreductase